MGAASWFHIQYLLLGEALALGPLFLFWLSIFPVIHAEDIEVLVACTAAFKNVVWQQLGVSTGFEGEGMVVGCQQGVYTPENGVRGGEGIIEHLVTCCIEPLLHMGVEVNHGNSASHERLPFLHDGRPHGENLLDVGLCFSRPEDNRVETKDVMTVVESTVEQLLELFELMLGSLYVRFKYRPALPRYGMMEDNPVLHDEELFNHLVVQFLGYDDVGFEQFRFPVRYETGVESFRDAYSLHGILPMKILAMGHFFNASIIFPNQSISLGVFSFLSPI